MRLLLDTHALVWWLEGGQRLSQKARKAIADPDADVHVSAASAYEVSLKFMLGKFPEAEALVGSWRETIAGAGFHELDISARHALRAGSLPRHHRDPFDRLIVATALEDGLALVTNDAAILQYGAPVLW
ncbi:type II toxin-antitoxin system VapC family toxin [Hyphomonas sp.]|uniref:type II toxin-antitoxin system VapC family toxin n=1 Tax=Hyphomonas sp. TaxID=87 RepID=UPI00391D8E77